MITGCSGNIPRSDVTEEQRDEVSVIVRSFKMGTFGEGGLFSSSENEKVRSSLFLLCLSGGSDVDISLWVGEEEHDFFSDISDSSCSSSCCSDVLPSLRESSSPSSGSSSSSPPLP